MRHWMLGQAGQATYILDVVWRCCGPRLSGSVQVFEALASISSDLNGSSDPKLHPVGQYNWTDAHPATACRNNLGGAWPLRKPNCEQTHLSKGKSYSGARLPLQNAQANRRGSPTPNWSLSWTIPPLPTGKKKVRIARCSADRGRRKKKRCRQARKTAPSVFPH